MASKRWTWVTSAALLFAGLTNAHAHVHYCFDGKAPPTSVHHVDVHSHAHDVPSAAAHHDARDQQDTHHADEHDAEHDAEHDDLDLDVPNDALAKTLKHDLPAVVPAPLWTGDIQREPGIAIAARLDLPPAPDPPYSHPLLRAPPR